jgi:flagellar transcriptional activator FlhD
MQLLNQTSIVSKGNEMNAKQLHEEIKETNLAYMGLIQKMIRTDKAATMANMGVSEELADLVAGLSPAQLLKMSGTNLLLCCFHFDESVLLNMVTDHKKFQVLSPTLPAKREQTALAA